MYLKEFNKKGGVNGRQIVSIVDDERAIQSEAILVYNKPFDENVQCNSR